MDSFQDIIFTLAEYGVIDTFVPFLLVFVITYSALVKLSMFEKKVKVIIALSIALMTVAPHVLQMNLLYDPVDIINILLPSVGGAVVFIALVLLVFALFGTKFSGGLPSIFIILILLFLFYVLGVALGWWYDLSDLLTWWPSWLTFTLVVLGIFYILFSWFTKDDPSKKPSMIGEAIKELFSYFKK